MQQNSLNFDQNILIVSNLQVVIQKKVILKQVAFKLERRQIITLIGPNGAGKSTLVRAILGLIPITSGSVKKAANLKIGYMPQGISITDLMPLSVRRFLLLSKKATSETVDAVLEELTITMIQNYPIQKISGGELQRVLLARALLQQPDLLILDEPAQGVDVSGQAEFYQLIKSIRDKYNCGILMISHDLHFVMEGTDFVMCLNQHVCCSGHPEAVSQNPEFIALFGMQSTKNLAIYAHQHNNEHGLGGHVFHTKKQCSNKNGD